jgi:hypothetical protein
MIMFNNKIFKIEVFAGLLLLLCWLPYVLLGDNSSIRIHDNLDSVHAWYSFLTWENLFASNDTIIRGIRRGSLPLEFNITTLLYLLLGPLKSYIFERLLISFVAFFGMRGLLTKLLPSNDNRLIIIGVSLCFALLPFWPYGGISIAGIPMLLFAFVNYNNAIWNWKDVLILLFFAIYSSLILTGFFILVYLGCYFVIQWIKSRKYNQDLLLGIVLLAVFYILTHYRLFFTFLFDSDYTSHRVEFKSDFIGVRKALSTSWEMLLNQQIHSIALNRKVILPLSIFVMLFLETETKSKQYKLVLVFMVMIIFHALIYGLYQWDGLSALITGITRVLPLQFDRFYMLTPVLWFVLLALILSLISDTKALRKQFIYVVLLFQLVISVSNHELWQNRKKPTYSEFYNVDTYSRIKSELDKHDSKNYKVVSVGLDPVIAQFNGFETLDGYFSDYPLSEKKKFREIISGELARNEELRIYFDDWGSRKYIFSSELKNGNRNIDRLVVDYYRLKNNGVNYILSNVTINENKNRVKLKLRVGQNRRLVYVYQIV